MPFSSYPWWALLPTLLSAAAVSVSPALHVPSKIANEASVQSLHIDNHIAQASFAVPCANCIGISGVPTNQSFLFDLEAFPTEEPCGSSNLTLNGVPLLPQWESTGVYAQGLATVQSSGHELELLLTSNCLIGNVLGGSSRTGASQLLTLFIEKIDQRYIQDSPPGFTLSFKQTPNPDLIRLSLVPDSSARDPANAEEWRDPPANLRLHPKTIEDPTLKTVSKDSIDEHVEGLKVLEDQVKLLQRLIEEKKQIIHDLSKEGTKALKEEVKQCDSFVCVLKAIARKLNHEAKKLCDKLPHAKMHEVFTNHWDSGGTQKPTLMATAKAGYIQSPESCHCRDGNSTETPPINKDAHVSLNEKTQSPVSHASSEPQWKDAVAPSPLAIFLKALFVITGLAFLCRFIRRRCMSLRKRAERAADRERQRSERLYRRDARRQAWRDWWFGRVREQPGRRPGDYDEKRTLILRQEGLLEEVMQDDIRQLQIQEEIRQLRSTRDAVDDLVRAEEGRSGVFTQSVPSSSMSYHPFCHHQPTPITFPGASYTGAAYPTAAYSSASRNPFLASTPFHANSIDHDNHPPSPLSRTSSLPDYKTEASSESEPPSYSDDEEGVADGFSDYTPSTGTQDSHWSPGSSIPDISPRPSIETARTFL